MLCRLILSATAADGTMPLWCRDERNRPTPVRRWFSCTQEVQERLGICIPGEGGVGVANEVVKLGVAIVSLRAQ